MPGFLVYVLLAIDKHCHGLSSTRNMGNNPWRGTPPLETHEDSPLNLSHGRWSTQPQRPPPIVSFPENCSVSRSPATSPALGRFMNQRELGVFSWEFQCPSRVDIAGLYEPQDLLLTHINNYSGQYMLDH